MHTHLIIVAYVLASAFPAVRKQPDLFKTKLAEWLSCIVKNLQSEIVVIFDNCDNTNMQGNIGLGAAINYFTRNHYTVSLPLNDSQDYDFIVDKDNVLSRVQVKTTRYKPKNSKSYVVNLKVNGRSMHHSYILKNGCDVVYEMLFILCDDGSQYLIPKEVIKEHRSALCVSGYEDYRVA